MCRESFYKDKRAKGKNQKKKKTEINLEVFGACRL